MSRISNIFHSLKSHPGYTLMRGAARFGSMRKVIGWSRGILHGARLQAHMAECEVRMSETVFLGIDRADFVRRLREDGVAFGLKLPQAMTQEIVEYARNNPCYADRQAHLGFELSRRDIAEAALGKPILVAQYFNAAVGCSAIEQLLRDPLLQWIAGAYLGSVPTFVGSNLWWTFPVDALQEDRDRHAHLFHRDLDDFRFFKFFFYLTDVAPGDGGHVCVVASHRRAPMLRLSDRWNIRRYSDDEVANYFSSEQILEITGPAGTGFAENTLCVHKARTPQYEARLLLQLQYSLFDYGAMHDQRSEIELRRIA